MANFYSDNPDLDFYVQKYIDWERLVGLVENSQNPDAPKTWQEALDNYKQILDLFGSFAADEVAPRAAAMDKKGTHFEAGPDGNQVVGSPEHNAIFAQLKEMGVFGMCTPRELGGMNCPGMLYTFVCEMLARGDVSTMTHFGFHVATSLTLLSYSIHEGTTEFDERGVIKKTRFEEAMRKVGNGEAWGSMDLTEPNAGSDLAALRTRATQGADGTWRVTGNKIFITSGHGQYHLVLAKTEDRDSLDALSLLLVPTILERDGKRIKNVTVDRIEEKVGHHGSPTCSVQFDNAEGELIGKPGEGFRLMLQLMNHARIGVGFSSLGVCEAAYRSAKAYASERKSMGSTLDRHPIIADMLDEMELTIAGLRAMGVEAAMAEEMATHMEIAEKRYGVLNDPGKRREIKHLKKRSRYLTPLLKYLASEEAVRFCRLAMQIHGGNGYTQDYAPERLLRDALVLPVYEGTSQIQALMALKDNLGAITKNPQKFLRKVAAAKLNSVRAIDPIERGFYKLQSMAYSAEQHIMWKVAKDKWSEAMSGPLGEVYERFTKHWDPKRDFAFGLLHAENLARVLADVAIAEVLVEQAQRFPERRELAERWLERVEPRVRHHCDLIHSTGDRILAKLESGETKTAQVG